VITRPVKVTGYRSPYPTVVMLTIAHQIASRKVVIIASGCWCSMSYIARAET
jgi:hypothetical protein